MIYRLLISACLAIATLTPLSTATAAPVDFLKVSDELISQGNEIINAYVPAYGLETADAISDLYFDVFEASGMETAIGMQDAALKAELESLFGQIIGLASKSSPQADVQSAWSDLRTRLNETASAQPQGKDEFISTLVQSFLILLREGFEAILVITALIAYLRRAGQGDKVRVIYHGTGWALVASALTAYVLTSVIQVSGTSREALEGITMLVAAAVLFYVSYWLITKRETERWQKYVHNQIDKAISGGRMFTLGFAAFLAVFREGAETVLFYQALLAGSEGQYLAITLGFAGASVSLAGVYWAMRVASFRLPLGLFFSVTAMLLYYLALTFAGKGVLELQEARWVSITPLEWMPRIEWLGLFPTVESASAQLVLLIPLLLVLVWWLVKRPRVPAQGAGDA